LIYRIGRTDIAMTALEFFGIVADTSNGVNTIFPDDIVDFVMIDSADDDTRLHYPPMGNQEIRMN
jgi:hypothetical protein